MWAATAPTPGKLVALKILHGNLDDPGHRLLAEIELEGLNRIRNLSHPNVLEILHLQVVGANVVVVTELADCSLQQHFRRWRRRSLLSACCLRAMSLLREVAEALDHLQRHGLMHLDVKPENLLLVAGKCKLADFGTVKRMRTSGTGQGEALLARHSGLDGPRTYTTRRFDRLEDIPCEEILQPQATLYTKAGGFTCYYAAPELLQTWRPSRFSDQYSLALTFCQLVADRIPFPGDPKMEMSRRVKGEMDLSYLPELLHSAVARALAPQPEARFPCCVDFIDALYDALAPEVLRNRSPIPVPPEIEDGRDLADTRPSLEGTTRRLPSVATRRGAENPPEAEPAVTEGPKPKSPSRWKGMVQNVAVLLLVLLLVLGRALHFVNQWGSWLAGRVFSARRGENRLVGILVLALASLVPLVLYLWMDRLLPIKPALKGTQNSKQEGAAPSSLNAEEQTRPPARPSPFPIPWSGS